MNVPRTYVAGSALTGRRLSAFSTEAALRDPHHGIGKPEHLKHLGGSVWSRRINEADRLVYEVFPDRIEFLQARYHYG
jgi:toxin YoeB